MPSRTVDWWLQFQQAFFCSSLNAADSPSPGSSRGGLESPAYLVHYLVDGTGTGIYRYPVIPYLVPVARATSRALPSSTVTPVYGTSIYHDCITMVPVPGTCSIALLYGAFQYNNNDCIIV